MILFLLLTLHRPVFDPMFDSFLENNMLCIRQHPMELYHSRLQREEEMEGKKMTGKKIKKINVKTRNIGDRRNKRRWYKIKEIVIEYFFYLFAYSNKLHILCQISFLILFSFLFVHQKDLLLSFRPYLCPPELLKSLQYSSHRLLLLPPHRLLHSITW